MSSSVPIKLVGGCERHFSELHFRYIWGVQEFVKFLVRPCCRSSMPTRIALKQTKHASKGANEIPRVASILSDTLAAAPTIPQRHPSRSRSQSPPSRRTLLASNTHNNNSPSKRQVLPSFRSSILRDLNVRRSSEDDAHDERRMLAAARDDIRASPRLLGYLFSMIAGAVMLASVVQ
jgi:hypothetical protein